MWQRKSGDYVCWHLPPMTLCLLQLFVHCSPSLTSCHHICVGWCCFSQLILRIVWGWQSAKPIANWSMVKLVGEAKTIENKYENLENSKIRNEKCTITKGGKYKNIETYKLQNAQPVQIGWGWPLVEGGAKNCLTPDQPSRTVNQASSSSKS